MSQSKAGPVKFIRESLVPAGLSGVGAAIGTAPAGGGAGTDPAGAGDAPTGGACPKEGDPPGPMGVGAIGGPAGGAVAPSCCTTGAVGCLAMSAYWGAGTAGSLLAAAFSYFGPDVSMGSGPPAVADAVTAPLSPLGTVTPLVFSSSAFFSPDEASSEFSVLRSTGCNFYF